GDEQDGGGHVLRLQHGLALCGPGRSAPNSARPCCSRRTWPPPSCSSPPCRPGLPSPSWSSPRPTPCGSDPSPPAPLPPRGEGRKKGWCLSPPLPRRWERGPGGEG